MNRYKTSAQLKEKAKLQLEGNFGSAIGMLVTLNLINFISGFLIRGLVPASALLSLILQFAVTFIVSAFLGVFQIGYTMYYLSLACGVKGTFQDLLYGFRNQFNKCLAISLIMAAFTYISQAFYLIPYYAGLLMNNATIDALFYPGMVLGIVVYFIFSLYFSLVYYLVLDFPDYSIGELFRQSCRLMKGHKGRLLYIMLSFIPLILLSVCTCMLGSLWIIPYEKMTKANFYLDLINPEREGGGNSAGVDFRV